MEEAGYQQVARQHKKLTGDVNLIDYDELKQSFGWVDSLIKMSSRLKIIGCSALSILHCDRMLNSGVCINGHVSSPDNFCVPCAHFFDNKVHSTETIAEFLITGLRQHVIQRDAKSHKYALSGSIIYLIIYLKDGLFNYIVYLSEEPINELIQVLKNQREFNESFDFIYTVVGRTVTEEEIYPYTRTQQIICFKNIVLYCNENQFSAPVLSTIDNYGKLANSLTIKVSEKILPKPVSHKVPALSSLILMLDRPLDEGDRLKEKLFDSLIKLRDYPEKLKEELSEILGTSNLSDINEYCSNPLDSSIEIAKSFIQSKLSEINLLSVYKFIDLWYSETQYERINEITEFIKEVETEREKAYQSILSSINTTEPDLLLNEIDDAGFGLFD
jgi:hypothetical protein